MAKNEDSKSISIELGAGKMPPQCIDIEESLIGAILSCPNILNEVIDLKYDFFYKDSHQKIFKAILDLNSNNSPIDLLTVCDQLLKNKTLDEVGGNFAVTNIMINAVTFDSPNYLSAIIKQKFLQRELIKCGYDIANKSFDNMTNIDDLISFSVNSVDLAINNALGDLTDNISWADTLEQTAKMAEKRESLKKDGQVLGIQTPLKKLNKFTGGWKPGDLIVIGARPSMGKTAFAISIILADAKNGGCPNFYSLETTRYKITDRILAGEAGVNYDNYTMGCMTSEEWQMISNAQYRLSKMNIIIDDNYSISIDYIRAKSRALKKKGKCTMIVIDYLQLMRENNMSKNSNREQEVSIISRKCKLLAKELEVPVFALSQLSREVEKRDNKIPRMSDLRESGSIEQDSDIVAFIHRPERYGITEDENGVSTKGIGNFIIEKNKEGKIGTIDFKYNESLTRIGDIDDDIIEVNPTEKYYNPNKNIEPNTDFEL